MSYDQTVIYSQCDQYEQNIGIVFFFIIYKDIKCSIQLILHLLIFNIAKIMLLLIKSRTNAVRVNTRIVL